MPAGESITSLCIWTRPHLTAPLPPNLQAAEQQPEPQNNRFDPSVSLQHVATCCLERATWQPIFIMCAWQSRNLVCYLPLEQQHLAPNNARLMVLAPSIPAGIFWAPNLCLPQPDIPSNPRFPHFCLQAKQANAANASCNTRSVRQLLLILPYFVPVSEVSIASICIFTEIRQCTGRLLDKRA